MSDKDKRLGNDPLDWLDKTTETEPKTMRKSAAGRPRTLNREIDKTSQEGLQENWTRYTVILREDLLEKLKDYAWTDRRSIKEVVNEMVEEYLSDKKILERKKK